MSFIVYKSSAGSGKTTTIVKEYLSLCLPNPDKFQSIIAITFTNKATAEMKSRLIEILNQIQNKENHSDKKLKNIIEFVKQKTNLNSDEICSKSTQLLDNILHNYSNFAFSTIDSFVVKIVRSFAYELGLDNNFEIELSTDKIIDHAVAELMKKIGEDKLITKLIVKFAIDNFNEDKSFNVENAIKNQASELFNSHQQLNIEKLSRIEISDFLEIINELKENISKIDSQLAKIGNTALDIFKEKNIPQNAFYRGTPFYNYFEKLAENEYKDYLPNATVISIIEEDKWYSPSKKSDIELIQKIDESKEKFRELFNQAMSILSDGKYEIYLTQKLIFSNIYPLGVLSILKKIIKEYSDENNIIHLSESNNKIFEIVENEPAPFIYERIGSKYQNYLIDEFQDTSRIQWNNLIPLINNSLAEGNMNMLVGDAKQSIYRWRDGDLKQFIQLPKIDGKSAFNDERQKLFEKLYQQEELNDNWRSCREIVGFNNEFFDYYKAHKADNLYITETYKAHKQNIKNTNDGFVQFDLIKKPVDRGEDQAEIMNLKILKIIENIISRGFEFKDICILARVNKQLIQYANFLAEHNIKTISNEALSITNSEKIHFLISFLKWIYRKDDELAMLHIVKFIADQKKLKYFELIRNYDKKTTTVKFLDNLLQNQSYELNIDDISSLSVFEAVNSIVAAFELNKNNDPYILQLLEVILSDYKGDANSFGEFINWWNENFHKIYIQVPENINAVQLLTIHKAKGLEFPFVIFTPKSDKKSHSKSQLWVNLEDSENMPKKLNVGIVKNVKMLQDSSLAEVYEEENKLNELDFVNMIYVAFTRPERELYSLISEKDDAEFFALIQNFISEKQLFTEIEENVYGYGTQVENEEKEEKLDDDEIGISSDYKFFTNDWRNIAKLKINYSGNLNFDEDNLLEKGKHIHSVLSKIYNIDDFEAVIENYRQLGIIENSEIDYIEQKINEMLKNKLINSFFDKDNKVLNEQNILLPNSKEKIPDRIIQREDSTIIVDYKLSDYESINQNLLQKYKAQISEYSDALSSMGLKNIKSYLVFLKGEINVLEVV